MTGSKSTNSSGQPSAVAGTSSQRLAKNAGANDSSTTEALPKKTAGQAPGSIKPPAKIAGSNSSPPNNSGSHTLPGKKSGSENSAVNIDKRSAAPDHNQSEAKKRIVSAGSGSSQSFCTGMVAMRLFVRDGRLPATASENDRIKPGPMLDERSKFAMSHCFHLALALLERSTGHDAFIRVAKDIVEKRRKDAKDGVKTIEEGLFPGKNVDDVPKHINDFLSKVRSIGLPVCVTRGVKGNYGLTQRWTWGDDMIKYDPRTAAVVYLNKGMIEGLLDAADAVEDCMLQQRNINVDIEKGLRKADDPATKKDLEAQRKGQVYAQMSFERAIFCMAVTLAHEFVHCFTGYLSGNGGLVTPPDDQPLGPYGTNNRGEAGWKWCNLTFGGLAHFWYTRGSPHRLDSGYYIGIPVLMHVAQEDWQQKSVMYMIEHKMVKKIIEMKDWESAYKADRNWMHKIRNQEHKGILYPQWFKENSDVVRIWDKYYGIPDVKSGKAIAMGQAEDLAFAGALKPVPKAITRPLTATDLQKTVKA